MSQFIVPSPDFRSPAAAPDQSGMRDDQVYSAVCVGNGATGSVNAFAQGQGGQIQSIGSTTNQQAFQKTFSLATTNLSQSGVVGSNIGDIGIREIGLNVQPAFYKVAANVTAQSLYGAGPQEVTEILNKMSYQLNLINKPMQQGPLFAFPAVGGPTGGYAVSMFAAAAATNLVGLQTNGTPGRPRKLEVVLVLARIDTIQAIFTVAGGDSLTFSADCPSLIWNTFLCNVAADLVG